MLVTFSTDAYENITMFGDVATRLLNMMGHSGTVPGALLAKDVPDALERLQQALALEKNKPAMPEASLEEEDSEVSLEQRAWPLIQLLRDAAKAECSVIWRVK